MERPSLQAPLQFSPIKEECSGSSINGNSENLENCPTPTKYNLRPKRFSFSTPKVPKANRYSSCSNIQECFTLGKITIDKMIDPMTTHLNG